MGHSLGYVAVFLHVFAELLMSLRILMQKDVRHLAERVSYLTEALEKEKIISKRKTVEKRGKMIRSRRSIVADELLLLGRWCIALNC